MVTEESHVALRVVALQPKEITMRPTGGPSGISQDGLSAHPVRRPTPSSRILAMLSLVWKAPNVRVSVSKVR